MTIARDASGMIVLSGHCTVEDAEPLLQLFQATPDASLHWTQCESLHTAVLQVILVVRPAVNGACGDPFVARWYT